MKRFDRFAIDFDEKRFDPARNADTPESDDQAPIVRGPALDRQAVPDSNYDLNLIYGYWHQSGVQTMALAAVPT